MIGAAKVLNFQSNLLLAVHYEIMYPYLKNKREKINKQVNTVQYLFSEGKVQRNQIEKKYVEKSCRRNPVEEFLSKIISAGISKAM